MLIRRLLFGENKGELTVGFEEAEQPGSEASAGGVKVAWSLADIPWQARAGHGMVPIGSFAGPGTDGHGWVIGMGPAASWSWASPRQQVTLRGSEFDPEFLPWLGLCLWIAGSLRKARFELGERVLILGAGVFAQLTTQWVRLGGAAEILVSNAREWGEEWALANGAHGFLPLSTLPERGGQQDEFDLVVDTFGTSQWLSKGLSLVRRGGRALLLAGRYGPLDFNFYTPTHARSLVLVAGEMPQDPSAALAFIAHLLATRRLTIDTPTVPRVAPSEQRRAVSSATGGILVQWRGV